MKTKISVIGSVVGCALLLSANVNAGVITGLVDNFEQETYSKNQAQFKNWNVVNGSVDLVGNRVFQINCATNSSHCVDLDGSTRVGGTLMTKDKLAIGEYDLTFDLSGNQRNRTGNQAFDTVRIKFGSYMKEITLGSAAPWKTYTTKVKLFQASHLSFENLGGDYFGVILDNVSVATVPEPPVSAILMGGLTMLFGLRRFSSKKA